MSWWAPQHILRLRSPDVVPAMHRRVALTLFSAVWWGPCERLEPSLIIFAFTLLLIEKAKEVPAAVSPPSQRTSSPTSPRRGVRVQCTAVAALLTF